MMEKITGHTIGEINKTGNLQQSVEKIAIIHENLFGPELTESDILELTNRLSPLATFIEEERQ